MYSFIVHLEGAIQDQSLSQLHICCRDLLSQDVVTTQCEAAMDMVARAHDHNLAFAAAMADPTACIRTLRICRRWRSRFSGFAAVRRSAGR